MHSVHKHNSSKNKKGFSLIELMVSLTIFSIVMTVSIGTLLVLINANTKAQSLSTAMTNISFALDSMSRNLRTASNVRCPNGAIQDNQPDRLINNHSAALNCPTASGNNKVVFTPGSDPSARVGYQLNNGQIEQWYDRAGETDGWVPITSNQAPTAVTIETLRFTVAESHDTSAGNYLQPRVSILIEGNVDNGRSLPTEFVIQSNVTQRVLNY